jgi:hypothetical protein
MKRLTIPFAVVAVAILGNVALAEEPTGDDYLGYHKVILGTWKATIQEGDKVSSGTATWKLGAKGKCFVVELEAEGLPALQALIGYNPGTKKIVQTIFDAAGGHSVSMLEMTDMTKGKKMSVGKIGTWEIKRYDPDGKVTTGTESFHCLEASNNRIVIVWSDRKQEGKSLPDFKLTYERQ